MLKNSTVTSARVNYGIFRFYYHAGIHRLSTACVRRNTDALINLLLFIIIISSLDTKPVGVVDCILHHLTPFGPVRCYVIDQSSVWSSKPVCSKQHLFYQPHV